SQYSNFASTTVNILTATGSWTNGYGIEDPSNKTLNQTNATGTYSEFEYAIKTTSNVISGPYCFRLTDNGSAGDFTYTEYPEITIDFFPTELTQYNTTHETVIPTGSTTDDGVSTNIYLDFEVASATTSDTITPKVEVRNVNTAFSGAITHTGTSFKYDPDIPRYRSFPSTIYDSANKRMIMFGGKDDTLTYVNDVWELKLPSTENPNPQWKELFPSGTAPEERSAVAVIYDARNQRMVTFGGITTGGDDFLDFWELTLPSSGDGAWTELSPVGTIPTARYTEAIYDAEHQRMMIFGGWDGVSDHKDIYEITLPGVGQNGTSKKLADTPANMEARSEHSIVYDPVNQRMIVVGGNTANASVCSGACLADIWELTLPSSGDGAWIKRTP
ncbi:MAG: hypothetical protein KAI72_04545, partial [Candidatus Pacebacteria bacterium]|nr:hypothetical protein [Candidatus Paceibacterota bacterium]